MIDYLRCHSSLNLHILRLQISLFFVLIFRYFLQRYSRGIFRFVIDWHASILGSNHSWFLMVKSQLLSLLQGGIFSRLFQILFRFSPLHKKHSDAKRLSDDFSPISNWVTRVYMTIDAFLMSKRSILCVIKTSIPDLWQPE